MCFAPCPWHAESLKQGSLLGFVHPHRVHRFAGGLTTNMTFYFPGSVTSWDISARQNNTYSLKLQMSIFRLSASPLNTKRAERGVHT